jgi:hypothetical protein
MNTYKRNLPMAIFPIEQARAQSDSFDMSQEQVLQNISSAIANMSALGERTAVVQFLKTAVSQQELDGALETVRGGGYVVQIIEASPANFMVRVNW